MILIKIDINGLAAQPLNFVQNLHVNSPYYYYFFSLGSEWQLRELFGTEGLLCVQEVFINISSFNHSVIWETGILTITILEMSKQALRLLSNFSKVAQLVKTQAGMPIQICVLWELSSFHNAVLPSSGKARHLVYKEHGIVYEIFRLVI